MTRLAALVVLSALLLGCKKEEDEGPDTTLRDAYFEAGCRLYTQAGCVQNMEESCVFTISFDTVEECEGFLRLAAAQCTGYVEAMNDNSAAVQSCIDDIEAFDCTGEEGICDEDGGDIFSRGDCGIVSDLIDALCPEDSGF